MAGRLGCAALIGIAACCTGSAQTSAGPYEAEVLQLVMEVKVDPASLRPMPESDLLNLVASGPYELRLRIDNWNARRHNYRLSVFLVAPDSPIPTNPVPDPASSQMLFQAVVRAESIFHTDYGDSGPGLAVAGRVSDQIGGFGQIDPGEVWAFGLTYNRDAIGAPSAVNGAFRDITIWAPPTNGYMANAAGFIRVAVPAWPRTASPAAANASGALGRTLRRK
jgi:hypothetical protein